MEMGDIRLQIKVITCEVPLGVLLRKKYLLFIFSHLEPPQKPFYAWTLEY